MYVPQNIKWPKKVQAYCDVFLVQINRIRCEGGGILWVEVCQNIENAEKWTISVQRLEKVSDFCPANLLYN